MYPGVRSALIETGEIEKDPIKRLGDTARDGLGLIFGTAEDFVTYKKRVYDAHEGFGRQHVLPQSEGEKAGMHYSPFTQEGQAVVASAIMIGSIQGYEAGVEPLSEKEKDQYIIESKAVFSPELRATSLPDTYEELLALRNEWILNGTLNVNDATRRLLPYVLNSHTLPREFMMGPLKLVTFAMLPPEIRRQLGQNLSPNQIKAAEAFLKGIRKTLPHLPPQIRYVKQYLDAASWIEEAAEEREGIIL